MASTSSTAATAENPQPPVEQMMEEISMATETIRLEQRMEILKEMDGKIGELMAIVGELMMCFDKEKMVGN
jgi:hypothetical protein